MGHPLVQLRHLLTVNSTHPRRHTWVTHSHSCHFSQYPSGNKQSCDGQHYSALKQSPPLSMSWHTTIPDGTYPMVHNSKEDNMQQDWNIFYILTDCSSQLPFSFYQACFLSQKWDDKKRQLSYFNYFPMEKTTVLLWPSLNFVANFFLERELMGHKKNTESTEMINHKRN